MTLYQEFEKVQVLHRHAMASVPEVTEALNVCSVPGTIKEAEHLMQEDLKLKENLVNRVTEAELNIDSFVSSLDRQGSSEGVELGAGAGNAKDYMTMRNYLDDLLVELRTSLSKFDAFWLVHKARVDHMMRMCHFKKTAATVSGTWLLGGRGRGCWVGGGRGCWVGGGRGCWVGGGRGCWVGGGRGCWVGRATVGEGLLGGVGLWEWRVHLLWRYFLIELQ